MAPDKNAFGLESIGAIVQNAVHSQERALQLTEDWSRSMLGTVQEQAESYGTLLRSVDSSLRAMEQAVKSQAESTKALTESLEASRRVVDTAMSAQQQNLERVETFVGGLVDLLSGQLETLRTQMEMGQAMLSNPVQAQSEAFLKTTQDWMDAYSRILGAGPRKPGS